MRFLLYLKNAQRFSPKDIPQIKSVIAIEINAEVWNCAIKNIRVSDEEIQFDLFISGNNSCEVEEDMAYKIGTRFHNAIGPLNKIINLSDGLTKGLDESSIIQKILESFNARRYWEAQETAEAIWNKTKNHDERNVVQGVILTGAALVHHQRNEDEVCLSILRRALDKLQAFDKVSSNRRFFLSIDVESMRKEIQAILSDGKVRDIRLEHIET